MFSISSATTKCQAASLNDFPSPPLPAPFLPSAPEIMLNASSNLNSGEATLRHVFVSREGLCPGMYLRLTLKQFLARSLYSQKQLQNWASLTLDSWLWQSVEGKSYFIASLACLAIWEQASRLFFHWMQQVAYIFEGNCEATIFYTFAKASFSKTAEPCLLEKSGLLKTFQAQKALVAWENLSCCACIWILIDKTISSDML